MPIERKAAEEIAKLIEQSSALSASIRVGASPLAMMGDQSQSKRGKGWNTVKILSQAAMAKV